MTSETTAATGTASPRQNAAAPAAGRRLGLALAVISMTQLMLVLDELIVNTALPHIQRALHFSGTAVRRATRSWRPVARSPITPFPTG